MKEESKSDNMKKDNKAIIKQIEELDSRGKAMP
jgi:hypothetical protein